MTTTTITGNLAHDLTVRKGEDGGSQVFFTLIRNEKRGDTEVPVRYPMGVFGQQADNLAASAKKGDRLTAVCRIGNRTQQVFRNRAEDTEPTAMNLLTLKVQEVGPALTWATAAIQKNPRKSNGNDAFPESPAQSAPAAAPAAAKSAPAAAPAMAGAGAPVHDDVF